MVSMNSSQLNEYLACNSYLGSKACATLVDYQQYKKTFIDASKCRTISTLATMAITYESPDE